MPQVFPKSANTLVKLSVVVGALLIGSVFVGGSTITRSPYNTKATVPLDQPIPFSHKHHAKELGIDCRYCHTSVEVSGVANVPPTETCMSCHSQIWTNSPLLEPLRESYRTGKPLVWNRVNRLPDFVYFNHSIHVNKGIACENCHGQMWEEHLTYKSQPFHMVWCLNCHREPEKNIRPVEEIFNQNYKPKEDQIQLGQRLVKEYNIHKEQLTNCSVCHR